MLKAEAEQVHAIAKLEIAAALAELENKIKGDVLAIVKAEIAKAIPKTKEAIRSATKSDSLIAKPEKPREIKKNT